MLYSTFVTVFVNVILHIEDSIPKVPNIRVVSSIHNEFNKYQVNPLHKRS